MCVHVWVCLSICWSTICNSAMLCAFICVVYEKPTTRDGMPLLSPPPPPPPPSPESSSVAKLERSWLCSLKNRTNDLSEPQHNKPSCHTLYTVLEITVVPFLPLLNHFPLFNLICPFFLRLSGQKYVDRNPVCYVHTPIYYCLTAVLAQNICSLRVVWYLI